MIDMLIFFLHGSDGPIDDVKCKNHASIQSLFATTLLTSDHVYSSVEVNAAGFHLRVS